MRFLITILAAIFVAAPALGQTSWSTGSVTKTVLEDWSTPYTADFTTTGDTAMLDASSCNGGVTASFDASTGDASLDAELVIYACPTSTSPDNKCIPLPLPSGAQREFSDRPIGGFANYYFARITKTPLGGDTARVTLKCLRDNTTDSSSFGGSVTLRTGADADSTTTQSDSGLELISGELAMLRGCGDNQILKWDETQDDWNCEDDSGGDTHGNAVTIGDGGAGNKTLVFDGNGIDSTLTHDPLLGGTLDYTNGGGTGVFESDVFRTGTNDKATFASIANNQVSIYTTENAVDHELILENTGTGEMDVGVEGDLILRTEDTNEVRIVTTTQTVGDATLTVPDLAGNPEQIALFTDIPLNLSDLSTNISTDIGDPDTTSGAGAGVMWAAVASQGSHRSRNCEGGDQTGDERELVFDATRGLISACIDSDNATNQYIHLNEVTLFNIGMTDLPAEGEVLDFTTGAWSAWGTQCSINGIYYARCSKRFTRDFLVTSLTVCDNNGTAGDPTDLSIGLVKKVKADSGTSPAAFLEIDVDAMTRDTCATKNIFDEAPTISDWTYTAGTDFMVVREESVGAIGPGGGYFSIEVRGVYLDAL